MKNNFFLLLIVSIGLSCCKSDDTQKKMVTKQHDNTYYTERHRPQFHFSPEKAWMNDPNGMVFYEGEYHLFYQYYPDSTVWGPMHWAHAVSKDMVTWEHLPIAIFPDSSKYIFSGSAVVDWHNTSGFGQNDKPPLVAMYTIHDMAREKEQIGDHESQGIAYSNDRGRTWTKYEGNPVLPNPNKLFDFRDPKVFWHEPTKKWVVVMAVKDHVSFWGSKDFKKWEHLSDFGANHGKHDRKLVWECPDFFEINDGIKPKWVLIENLNPGGYNGGSAAQYFVGDFDGKTFTLDPNFVGSVSNGKACWLDYGKDNYASVSWSDIPTSDGRRLYIGWMSNWEYATKVPTDIWRSASTLPRELLLKNTPNGYRLFSKPVKELEKLRRGKPYIFTPSELASAFNMKGRIDFPTTLTELELEFEVPESNVGTFGVEISNRKNEDYRIGYDAAKKQYFSDRTRAGDKSFSADFAPKVHVAPRTSTAKTIKMHLFFDTASCELFADDGETVMTQIFFPSEDFNQMTLFSDDGTVKLVGGELWPLKSIWR